jgi:tetratricopeptide (TPR) repeat protein
MKTRKKLNYRFIACILAAAAAVGVGVHFVHGYQIKRNAVVLLRQADQAKEKSDYAEELQYLSQYLGFEPDDIDARVRFGEVLHEQAKNVGSLRGLLQAFFQFDTVLRRDPQRNDVRQRQVDIALSLGRPADGLSHLKILHKDAPEDAKLEQKMGLCHELLGQFREAVAAYKEAVKHSPEQLENYQRLAILYHERLDNIKQADEIMDQMVKSNPKAFGAYLARAQYRLQFHGQSPIDVEKANIDVQKASELAPDEPEVVLVAARVEQRQGKTEEARKLLRKSIRAHPSNPRLYLELFTVEVREGKIKEALTLVRQGLKEVPEQDKGYGDLLHAKADLLVQNGDVKEAKETIARLREMKFAAPLLDYLQSHIHVHEKEWSKAGTLLDRIRPQLGRWPALEAQALLLLGQCHEQLGNPDQALLAYQQARKLDPLSASAHYRIGSLLMNQGRSDEAVAEFRQALATAKKPAAVRAMLVQTLIAGNRRLPAKDRNLNAISRELALAAKESPDSVELTILQADTRILQAVTQLQLADAKQLDAAKKDYGQQLEAARRLIEKARDAHPDEVRLWIASAQLAGREEALGILQRAADRPKLAARVELPLARLGYLMQPLTEAKTPEMRKKTEEDLRVTLARMEKEAAKLAETDRPRLFSGLADMYLRLGDRAAAERLWRRVAEQQPTNLDVRLRLFDLALQAKSPEKMDRVLKEMLGIEGDNGAYWRFAEALRLLQQARPPAKEEFDRSQLRKARQRLVEAAKLRPSWPNIPALEAEIDELEGNPSAAIEKYQEALKLGDRRPRTVQKVVQLLYQQGRINEAHQAVHKLRDQGNTLLLAGLGMAQAIDLLSDPDPANRDPQRALNVARLSVAPDSKAYQDHLRLGIVCWAAGKPEEVKEAEKEFKRACELGKKVPETWTTLVAFLASTGKKKEAEQAIAQATKKLPSDQAPLALAACYESIGDVQKADEHYQAALKTAPEQVRILRSVASFQLRHGQLAKAEPHLRAILALDQSKVPAVETAWARRALAGILASGGNRRRFDEAMELIQKNLDDLKDSVADQHARALLLGTRISRRKEAIRLFEDLNRRSSLPANERFLLAQLYLLEDNWSEAETQMRILLASPQGKDPTYEAFYARHLLQHDNVAAAQVQLEQLEKTLPDAPLTREVRARVFQAQGKDAEAIAVIREYAQGKDADLGRAGLFLETLANIKRTGDQPGNRQRDLPGRKLYLDEAEAMLRKYAAQLDKPDRLLTLAVFLGRSKQAVVEALACCEKALDNKAAPERVAPVMAGVLRDAHAGLEHCRRVEQTLKKMLAANPDSVAVLVSLADVYDVQKRYSDAEALYRRGLSKDANNVMLLNNLAWLLAFQKRPAQQEALAAIDKAIDQAGPAPELLDTQGVVYLKLGQPEQAEKVLQTASTLSRLPNHTFHFAWALVKANKLKDARQVLEEANKRGFDVQKLHPLEKPAGLQVIAVLQAE